MRSFHFFLVLVEVSSGSIVPVPLRFLDVSAAALDRVVDRK